MLWQTGEKYVTSILRDLGRIANHKKSCFRTLMISAIQIRKRGAELKKVNAGRPKLGWSTAVVCNTPTDNVNGSRNAEFFNRTQTPCLHECSPSYSTVQIHATVKLILFITDCRTVCMALDPYCTDDTASQRRTCGHSRSFPTQHLTHSPPKSPRISRSCYHDPWIILCSQVSNDGAHKSYKQTRVGLG